MPDEPVSMEQLLKQAKKSIEITNKAQEGIAQVAFFYSELEFSKGLIELQVVKGAFILGWQAVCPHIGDVFYAVMYRAPFVDFDRVYANEGSALRESKQGLRPNSRKPVTALA